MFVGHLQCLSFFFSVGNAIVISTLPDYHTHAMKERNFFQFFGLPVSYDIDESALTRIYLEKQKTLHPDISYSERAESASVELNTAYKTLMNPVSRAEHYLFARGASVVDELSTDFAEEMFRAHQEYSSLKNQNEKRDFVASLKKRKEKLVSSLRAMENDLEKFKKFTGLLRFISSFLEKSDVEDVNSWN